MSPTRVTVDDDEQQLADLEADLRRLRSRLATTAVTGSHDEFTAAATPSTTYTLTYIPLTGTCLMALNGHVQREGTDYTVAYDTGLVTVSATQASGDKITFRYLITDWLVARSLTPDTGAVSDNYNRANSATSIGTASDGGTYLIDSGAVYGITGNKAYLVSGTGTGYTPGTPNAFSAFRDVQTAACDFIIDITRSSTSGSSCLWICQAAPGVQSGYQLTYDSSATFGALARQSTDGHTLSAANFLPTAWTGGTTTLKLSSDGAGNVSAYQLVAGSWVLVCSIGPDPFPLTGTLVGFGAGGTSAGLDQWDNFSATSA